jgi:hypothetical protein
MALPETNLSGYRLLRERIETSLSLIEEHPTIEFKEDQKWDTLKQKIVRTALAMANLEDGGIIVIGVSERDQTRTITGVSDENLATYEGDTIKQAIDGIASSPVRLEVAIHLHDDKHLVAIRVLPFDDLPIVCKRDGDGIKEGQLFYRPSTGGVRTAVLSNERDMLDLIQRAAFKQMAKLNKLSKRFAEIKPDDHAAQFFAQAKFSSPWFAVSMSFERTGKHELGPQFIENWIRQNQVSVSGWPFPFWPSNESKVFVSREEVGYPIDLTGSEHDKWRIRYDGHVLRAVQENVATNPEYQQTVRERFRGYDQESLDALKGILDFDVLIRNYVEPLEFASRALRTELFRGDVSVSIELHNVAMWAIGSRNRSLWRPYFFRTSDVLVEERLTHAELVTNPSAVIERYVTKVFEVALLRLPQDVLSRAISDRMSGNW